jgi:hypothetical protein
MSTTEELSYEELKLEIINDLKQQRHGALATSDGENVTNRFMGLFPDGLTLYCFTGENNRKFKQLLTNPKVSIATGSLQIDGIATNKGHPLDTSNTRFIELFKKQNPEDYKIHEKVSLPNPWCRVIEIAPKRIGKWKYNGFLDLLNVSTRKAYRIEIINEFQVPEYFE